MIGECYLLDGSEYREGFIHRVLRCSPATVERVDREGWTELGAGSVRGYRVIQSGGCLYEASLVPRSAQALEKVQ